MAVKTITLGLDYSQVTKGIKETESELTRLDADFKRVNSTMNDGASASDKAAERMGYLSDRVALQQQKVDGLRQKYEMLKDSHADTSQINRAYTAWSNAQTKLNEYQQELDMCGMSQQQLMGIMAASIATITAVGNAWVSCATSVAEYVDDIQTMSQKSGASLETVQVWQTMADTVDVSAETMSGAMAKLTKSMASAKDGSGSSADAFKKLGVSVTDSRGHLKNAEDVLWETFDALSQMKNETEKDALAMEIFGKGANEMAGYIDMGADGFADLSDKARQLGGILSGEDIAAAAEFNSSLEEMSVKVEGVKNRIGAAFAPVLTVLVDMFNAIPTPVLAVGAAIGSLVVVVIAAAAGIAALSASMTFLSASASAAAAAVLPFLAEMAPFIAIALLLAGAIWGIVEAFKALQDAGGIQGVLDSLSDKIENMITRSDMLSNAVAKVGKVFQSIIQFIENVFQAIQRVTEALANFWANVSAGPAQMQGVASMGSNSIGHNASGTDNWRGGLTWVGEEGPELVSLPRGSQVFNNTDSRNMSNYSINMTLDLSKMKSINDVVKAVQGLGLANGGI